MSSTSLLSRLLVALRDDSKLTGEPWPLPGDEAPRLQAARWAYRLILLREPDSQAALEHLARTSKSTQHMRDTMLQSAEARAQPGFPVNYSMSGNEPPQEVQVRAAPHEEQELFDKVQAVWRSLGDEKPHWSVITADAFKPGNIDAAIDHFYASGEANVATLVRTLERNQVDVARLRSVMDFGCGVGRLTASLARRFERVHGVDVSESHLAVAREALGRRGIDNVELHALASIAALDALPKADLVFSVIVLQHNPPPVMRALFAGLLGRLEAGGVAVIQVPTYLPAGYRFNVHEYAKGGGKEMEMHALPQREVFALARAAGVDVLEVMEDSWIGYGAGTRSNTFVMRRTAADG